MNLFTDDLTTQEYTRQFHITGGDLLLYPGFFSQSEADKFLSDLSVSVEWTQERGTFYGEELPFPRLTAWYGDAGKSYAYSGIRVDPLPWTEPLSGIKTRIEAVSGTRFNSVLLNLYRSGSDSVAWHSDDEPELGENPTIASVSFGQDRMFHLKHKHLKSEKLKLLLPHGSLLLMRGETQKNWLHQVPKSKRELQTRINLTFRYIC